MTIKFIPEEVVSTAELTFDLVRHDQFFVDTSGRLCQKVNQESYNIIADEFGNPHALKRDGCIDGLRIKRILPIIAKIEF